MGGYPLRLKELLRDVYRQPLAIQSDRARKDADVVAMAASLQLITTRISATEFARAWRVTTKGLTWLNEDQ